MKNIQKKSIKSLPQISSKEWLEAAKKAPKYSQVRPDYSAPVIDSKKWIEMHKNAPEYPQVRPDDSPDVIDSKMWLEAAKNSRQSPKVRPNDSTKMVADKSWIELSKKSAHKAIQYILIAVVVGLLIFLGLLVTIETVHPNETFARDILGLSVPDSGILFFFSLHGIIVTIVGALLFYILKLFMHSSKSIE